MKRVAESYKDLRNRFRFLLGNLYDFDPAQHAVAWEKLEPLDQYMLVRTRELATKVLAWYEQFEFHRIYHAVNEFANVDLSALYADVLKDRLYTFAPNHPARRSAQTALWRIAETLTRLVAPILSFTADEVWQSLPPVEGRETSVHLALFPDIAEIVPGRVKSIEEDWEQLLAARDQVLLSLEAARQAKLVGKGLDARVHIETSEPTLSLLRRYESSLKELFNVSQVSLAHIEHPDGETRVVTAAAEGIKCERCWNYTTDVGNDARYPTVCLRCAEALDAIGYPPYAAKNSSE
jgi:isoleucyl-tRNA synthetase